MSTQLFFFDALIKKRVLGVDQDAMSISKENYESDNILERVYSLTPAVNEVISNVAGTFLLAMDIDEATAQVTLYVDSQEITVRDAFLSIISGTTISITSTIATDVTLMLIKVI